MLLETISFLLFFFFFCEQQVNNRILENAFIPDVRHVDDYAWKDMSEPWRKATLVGLAYFNNYVAQEQVEAYVKSSLAEQPILDQREKTSELHCTAFHFLL